MIYKYENLLSVKYMSMHFCKIHNFYFQLYFFLHVKFVVLTLRKFHRYCHVNIPNIVKSLDLTRTGTRFDYFEVNVWNLITRLFSSGLPLTYPLKIQVKTAGYSMLLLFLFLHWNAVNHKALKTVNFKSANVGIIVLWNLIG